jgi:hypothetical protein
MAGRLSIEKLAAYRAAIEAGENREAVVRKLGETVATWAEQEEQILAELANEADRGAFQRIEAYQVAYNAAWAGWVAASSGVERPSAAEPSAQMRPADLDTTSELARAPSLRPRRTLRRASRCGRGLRTLTFSSFVPACFLSGRARSLRGLR